MVRPFGGPVARVKGDLSDFYEEGSLGLVCDNQVMLYFLLHFRSCVCAQFRKSCNACLCHHLIVSYGYLLRKSQWHFDLMNCKSILLTNINEKKRKTEEIYRCGQKNHSQQRFIFFVPWNVTVLKLIMPTICEIVCCNEKVL